MRAPPGVGRASLASVRPAVPARRLSSSFSDVNAAGSSYFLLPEREIGENAEMLRSVFAGAPCVRSHAGLQHPRGLRGEPGSRLRTRPALHFASLMRFSDSLGNAVAYFHCFVSMPDFMLSSFRFAI